MIAAKGPAPTASAGAASWYKTAAAAVSLASWLLLGSVARPDCAKYVLLLQHHAADITTALSAASLCQQNLS